MKTQFARRERFSRLLIVEDDHSQLQTLSDIMEGEGFQVIGCSTANDAIQHVCDAEFGVAIIDLHLPDLEGTRLLEQIHELNGQVRVIIHTGHASLASAKEAINSGAFGYVEKLGDPEELVRHVHRAVADHVERYTRQLEAAVAERTAALRVSEARFRAAIEGSLDAFFLLRSERDDEGKIVDFIYEDLNLNAVKLVDRPASELIGRRMLEIFPMIRTDGFFDKFVQVVETGEPYEEEFAVPTPEVVQASWLHHQVVPVDDGIAITVRDITEKKQMEEQFFQSQKMEAIGRLAGGVAHDFNNQLTVITGYSDYLLSILPPSDPSREALREIRIAGERAASLTRQLLAYSRKQLLAPVVLDLNALVANMEKMLRRLIGENIELISEFDPGLGRVKADPGQIEQVVLNLVVNARDAMGDMGTLRIETKNVVLDSSVVGLPDVHPGPYALLRVSDTGCGMEEDIKSHIFEPFFTTKEVGKGTGLGLATIYGIITQSGGHIVVDSDPGCGSTFDIYLPRVAEAATITEASAALQRFPRGTETILLVEDEEAVRMLARQVLEMLGYKVIEAKNGVEAMEIAAQYKEHIHLLVTDVVMPKLGGAELVRRLAPIRPKIKVLFLSGYSETPLSAQNLAEHAFSLLQKPFTPKALACKVRDVIDDAPGQKHP